jgi:L-threonylcarbamoyladenylate synthase
MIISKEKALKLDMKNKIIVFPTDTVYGIGCLYNDIKSIQRIYDIKNRDYSKPMVILCSSLEEVKPLIKDAAEIREDLTKFWPGKLTIIFFKSDLVYDIISAGKNTVGIRIPNNDISLSILKQYGPMVVTSLNQSNEPPITNFSDVLKYENIVDYIVNGGDLDSLPSTVYDSTTNKVLRQGDVIIPE